MKKQELDDHLFDCMEPFDLPSDQSLSQEEKDMLEPAEVKPKTKQKSYKNKYINKLRQSVGGRSTTSRKKNNQSEQDLPLEQTLSKKLKNKVAAKESRDRKKQYIKIVEKETLAVEEELAKVTKQLEECKGQIVKNTFSASQHIGGSFQLKVSHISNKIRKLIKQDQTEERNNQINLAIDSLSYRFAAMGKERRSSSNQCYRQIINLAVPTVHRYILWAAFHHCHIFKTDPLQEPPEDAWYDQLKNILGSQSEDQKITKIGQSLREMHSQMMPLISKLMTAKTKVEQMCEDLDQTLLEESYRYREELHYHEKIWAEKEEKMEEQ